MSFPGGVGISGPKSLPGVGMCRGCVLTPPPHGTGVGMCKGWVLTPFGHGTRGWVLIPLDMGQGGRYSLTPLSVYLVAATTRTVDMRAVRILLKCFLIKGQFCQIAVVNPETLSVEGRVERVV